MRGLMTFIYILSITAVSAAQDLSPDKVLKNLEKEVKKAKSMDIAFTETTYWPSTGDSTSIDGSLLLKGEKQFKIETDDQIMVADGSTVWTFSKYENRVLIDKIAEDETQMLPHKMLFHFTRDYDVQSMGKVEIGDDDCAHLIFRAKSDASLYPGMELWVSTKTWLPQMIKQVDIDGLELWYHIRTIAVDQPHSESDFEFQAPEGADVVDLR